MSIDSFIKSRFACMNKKELTVKIIACIIGNVLIGLGVALTKMAALGNDPFNGKCMAVSAFLGVPYTYYTLGFNTFLFIFELIWGRKYINIGTFINWFLLCYVVSFFLPIFESTVGYPDSLPVRLLILVVGLLICSLGIALYQYADLGVAPYDAIPLMIVDHHPKVKFFAARVTLDCTLVILILLCGGPVNIGTAANAFGLGPIVHFYMWIIGKIMSDGKKTDEAS